MLKIVNQYGRLLELNSDQVITVDKYNPLFNDPDKLLQDVSYPGTAPFTESNEIFFGQGNLVEASTDSYVLPAYFFIEEIQLAQGLIYYRISPDGFEFNLEPNLTSVNSLLKNIRITQIITEDADYSMANDLSTAGTAFSDMMLDSAKNPDKYPFIFFPVYNPGNGAAADHSTQFVNFYNPATQKFIAASHDVSPYLMMSPYFKVAYIIKQIAAYLGFVASGSFFTNPDTKNICIYTRVADIRTVIQPCMSYMPNMLISDFLKQLRERLHLALDFNLGAGTLTVETFKTIKVSNNLVDLSKYITITLEQELPAQQSFTVTLKSDEQDAAFKVTDLNNNDTYPPLFTLIAGAGDTTQELDCSTTKGVDLTDIVGPGAKYPFVNQTVINTRISANVWDGALPPDIAYTDLGDHSTLNNWPLRLIKYVGYEAVVGGHHPNAVPYDLNDDDADYNRFLNDSKRLIITAAMPAYILSGLKMTDKYTHRTAGNNFTTYILEEISYDAGMNSDLIQVTIHARTIVYNVNTKVTITPLTSITGVPGVQYSLGTVKAYFDEEIHGITQLQVDVIASDNSVIPTNPIISPTTYRGSGGVAIPIIVSTGSFLTVKELRVHQGHPKYMITRGVRVDFTKVADYYKVAVDIFSNRLQYDYDDYVIFF